MTSPDTIITLSDGCLASFVLGGVRLSGVMLKDGRVFKDGVIHAPVGW